MPWGSQSLFSRSSLAFALVAALLLSALRADNRTARQDIDWAKAADSTVAMVDKNGNIHGTGFFIDADGDVVTAAHVVIGFAGAKAQMFVHQRGTHDDHAVSIIAIDNGLDIAILRTGIKTKNFFKLVESDSLQPGDKLYVVGHPYGVPWQMLEGLFSAHGVFDGHYILWVSVWIERGCSGGPILNSKGEVVGLVDAFYNPMAPVAGHTNICIPGTDILRLLLAARES